MQADQVHARRPYRVRRRPALPLTAAERRWWPLTDLSFVLAAAACWAFLPAGHPLSAEAAAVAVIAFVISDAVSLPLSTGTAVLIQPAFVLMLFAFPFNVVPAVVMVSHAAGTLLRTRNPGSLNRVLADCWYCLAPTLVLAFGSEEPASWGQWPVYVAAFGAQLGVDSALSAFRRRIHPHASRADFLSAAIPGTVDALLTPIGLAAAIGAIHEPAAAAAILAGTVGMLTLLNHERLQHLEQEERTTELRSGVQGILERQAFERHQLAIARDLHETLAQEFTAAGIYADLAGQTAFADPARAVELLSMLSGQITSSSSSLRMLIDSLRTETSLQQAGSSLLASTRALVAEFHRQAERVKLTESYDAPEDRAAGPEVIAVYIHVLRETLQAARDAGAENVGISLNATEELMTLTVVDDRPDTAANPRMELEMAEWAQKTAGTVQVERASGDVRLELRIPRPFVGGQLSTERAGPTAESGPDESQPSAPERRFVPGGPRPRAGSGRSADMVRLQRSVRSNLGPSDRGPRSVRKLDWGEP